jgi:hypothetical protein
MRAAAPANRSRVSETLIFDTGFELVLVAARSRSSPDSVLCQKRGFFGFRHKVDIPVMPLLLA